MQPCEVCGGKGYIEYQTVERDGEVSDPKTAPCTYCEKGGDS